MANENSNTATATVTAPAQKPPVKLNAAAHNNDSVVLVGWDWEHGKNINGCLGFALTRINAAGKREIIETHMPFDGQDNKDWKTKPSTEWPIQRKWWLDFTGKTGETYTYEIQAMGGKPDSLKPIDGVVVTTNAVSLRTKVDDTFDVAFTRGVLSTQWLAHMIGLDKDGNPDFQKVIDALSDFEKADNVIRRTLVGNVPELLMAPITECVKDGGHVNLALYELSSKQLVDFLKKHLKYFSLILGNTGKDDLTNAPARKDLHALNADMHDRIIGEWGIPHNKSQVKLDKSGKPTDVTTGSTNWTDTGMGCQANMVARIRNAEVAANYQDYWQRLLADNSEQSAEFRARNAKGYTPVKLADGSTIETWFQPSMPEKTKPKNAVLSPFLKRVKELMEGAQDICCGEVFYPGSPSVVQFMANIWDNNPQLYMFLTVSTPDALGGVKAKRRPGRQPLFTIATGREKDFGDFVKELLKLPEAHAITHGKIICIDPFGKKPVVIFGSDNLGAKASYGNDENALIVIGNKALAQYVFVNMVDVNKHYQSRAAARAQKLGQKNSSYTGKLSSSDSWQGTWTDGYKAREAALFATGVWDGSGLVDDPNLKSEFVVPFNSTPRPSNAAAGPVPGDDTSKDKGEFQHFDSANWQ